MFRLVQPFGVGSRSGGGAGFVPTEVAGLLLWLKGDTGVYSDAGTTPAVNTDPVYQWNDQSGNANHVLQATLGLRPLYATNIQNGKAVIDFDGSDDTLKNTATSLITANTAYTVFVVAKSDIAGGGALFCIRLTTTYSGSIVVESAGVDYMHGDGVNAASNITIADSAFKTSPFLTVHRYTGASAVPTFFVNAAERAVTGGTAQGTESGTTGFSVGMTTAAAVQWWNGWIAEVLFYNTALSTANRQSVESYLNSRWAIY